MADRPIDHGRLGGLRRCVLRHHHASQNSTYQCGKLVLCRIYSGGRDVARGQQRRTARVIPEVLFAILRCSGRNGAVVVRAQRSRFFLTAGFLGIMYYFVPKQAERPVYSYRLSVVHFWALTFTYIWAGPHHLHYTALPYWAQSLGIVFSLILLAPSWGGMINGIMTLSGAWEKLRTDPILKFLIVSISFYGMATFEGPMMSIKTVNSLSHYTDWTIGHVHAGALGWVALISIGAMYYLIPRLYGQSLGGALIIRQPRSQSSVDGSARAKSA